MLHRGYSPSISFDERAMAQAGPPPRAAPPRPRGLWCSNCSALPDWRTTPWLDPSRRISRIRQTSAQCLFGTNSLWLVWMAEFRNGGRRWLSLPEANAELHMQSRAGGRCAGQRAERGDDELLKILAANLGAPIVRPTRNAMSR